MSDFSASTVTISKEDGKLIIVRKPIPQPKGSAFSYGLKLITSCLKWFAALFMFIVIGIFLFGVAVGGIKPPWYLVPACIFLIFGGVLIIREELGFDEIVLPPGYEDEILTFEADKLVVQYYGMTTSFSYSRNMKPVLRLDEPVSLFIPCAPLDDEVPDEFSWGYYDMAYLCAPLDDEVPYESQWGDYEMSTLEIDDATRILDAITEYLDAV